jgi:hypothetical protein
LFFLIIVVALQVIIQIEREVDHINMSLSGVGKAPFNNAPNNLHPSLESITKI